MITVTKYRHQWVGILGFSRTGTAAAFSLLTGGAKIIIWESNTEKIEQIKLSNDVFSLLFKNAIMNGILVINPHFETVDFKKVKAVVLSPGIDLNTFKEQDICGEIKRLDIPIISDIELLNLSCNKAILIGVTGTNGKSTTTALIHHILSYSKLSTQMGGNIGVASLSLEPLGGEGTYVIEASSYQLDMLKQTRFNIAILLNITPDHYDRHVNFTGYRAAKLKIFNNQTKNDHAIISVDTNDMKEIFDHIASTGKQKIIPISVNAKLTNGVSIINDTLYDLISNDEIVIKLPKIANLQGLHNMQNIAAAYACARLRGVDEKTIISALKTFSGLKHRMQLILEHKNLKFINDSKATNATSTEQALKSFNDIYWILGGVVKEGGIDSLKNYFKRIKHVYLIGSSQNDFAKTLECEGVEFTKADDLNNALKIIKESNIQDGVVLLSPSCSSLDQWNDYEERGNAFETMVKNLWRN